jgi:hypothetical protein
MLESFKVNDGQVLDIRKLIRMRGYLDNVNFLEIIGDFEQALRQRLANLAQLPLQCSEIDAICHDLMNISGTLGMCELMSASERLRESARHKRQSDITFNRMEALTAGERALIALHKYKKENGV